MLWERYYFLKVFASKIDWILYGRNAISDFFSFTLRIEVFSLTWASHFCKRQIFFSSFVIPCIFFLSLNYTLVCFLQMWTWISDYTVCVWIWLFSFIIWKEETDEKLKRIAFNSTFVSMALQMNGVFLSLSTLSFLLSHPLLCFPFLSPFLNA